MERCPRAHGVERGTLGERLEMYWPYTHTGHTTSGHPATTLTGAVLPTKYRGATRHITGSHGARVAPSAQVHLLPSAGAQHKNQYCSPASAGHPAAVSLQRSDAGQSRPNAIADCDCSLHSSPPCRAPQLQQRWGSRPAARGRNLLSQRRRHRGSDGLGQDRRVLQSQAARCIRT